MNVLHRVDELRRCLGSALDVVGSGPVLTPWRTALRSPEVALNAYAGGGDGPALLLIPAPIKQAYVWDLLPAVSVIRRCMAAGLRVYLLQWQRPGAAQRRLGLADYADQLLNRCLDRIAVET